jgi:hypothetical protein
MCSAGVVAQSKSNKGKQTADGGNFGKGDLVLNLGVGFGNITYGTGYGMQVPPVTASLEFCVSDKLFGDGKGAIGVAPYIGYASWKYEYLGGDSVLTDIIGGVRGNLHYQFSPKLDTYAGLSLGYEYVKWKDDTFGDLYGGGVGGVYFGFLIGGRYYFSDKFGIMAEAGYGITILNVGVALKF